jgi:acyl-[acyl carrier protein]--UDP-N-acetylglucosamine O-acyltransferase
MLSVVHQINRIRNISYLGKLRKITIDHEPYGICCEFSGRVDGENLNYAFHTMPKSKAVQNALIFL